MAENLCGFFAVLRDWAEAEGQGKTKSSKVPQPPIRTRD